MASDEEEVLGEGRFLRLVRKNGWESVVRTGEPGVVVLVAVTDADELVLVEQFRPAVGARVLELPAGLVGDQPGESPDEVVAAGHRELLEETGFEARSIEPLGGGTVSPGLTSESVVYCRASGLTRVGPGGGVDEEDIEVHIVPLADVPGLLERRQRDRAPVDAKVWAGLYFAAAKSPLT